MGNLSLREAGFGPELEALERVGAELHRSRTSHDADDHFNEADACMVRAGAGYGNRHGETEVLYLLHAAAHLIFAARCVRHELEAESVELGGEVVL